MNSCDYLFYLKAGAKTGLGHLRRCFSIASFLHNKNNNIIFIVEGNKKSLNLAKQKGFKVIQYSKAALNLFSPKLAIMDTKNDMTKEILQLRSKGSKICLIDNHTKARLLSDIALYPVSHFNNKLNWKGFKGKKYIGAKYFPLNNEFLEKQKHKHHPFTILVTMGGSDPNKLTEKVVKTLHSMNEEFKVIIVLGAAANKQYIPKDSRFIIIRNSENMAKLMATSDIAITAFGTTLYELAYMGVPAIIISNFKDDRIDANLFQKLGTSIFLGYYKNINTTIVANSIKRLMQNRNLLLKLSKKGRNLVDGEGRERILNLFNKIKSNAVISLGAGPSQMLVIAKANKMGYSIISIDKNHNSPGFKESTEKIIKSTYDAKPILSLIRQFANKYNIKGILNRSSGYPVITSAHIAKAAGIHTYPYKSAEKIIDKASLIDSCISKGIPCPSHKVFKDIAQAKAESLTYPIIVKPALSLVGKKGVMLITSKLSLENEFNIIKSASQNGKVEIEEYIKGSDATLMSVVSNGKLYPITLMDELNTVTVDGKHKAIGYSVPSLRSNKTNKKILAIARKIIKTYNIKNSCLNLSFRVAKSGNPFLIEVHLDMGGDLILDVLMKESTKTDVLEYIIKALTGEKIKPFQSTFSPCAIIYNKGKKTLYERKPKILKAKSLKRLKYLIQKVMNK